jgi:circadian clock protein KaiC
MSKARPVENARVQTGISGLDDILRGGLPPHRLYLVEGMPGSGKTTLALQFLLNGIAAGEKSVYITLSETRDEIEEVAQSHGWSLAKLEIVELAALDEKIAAEAQSTLFHPSEAELTETTKFIVEAVDRFNPSRVALDSLSELRLLSQTALRYRRQILALKQYFTGRHCTTLFLGDVSAKETESHVESLAHGVIHLAQFAPDYGAERRRLIVRKIRGTRYRGGYHDFAIKTGGLKVFPRLVAAEHHKKFTPENVSSGVKGLDALLGGGLARGTSNLFTGPPGTGKSTLALKFALAAAGRGEKVLLFTFDESLNVLFERARGLKLGLEKMVDKKLVMPVQIDPAELTPGELAFRVQTAVEKDNVSFVYLDSLNGYLHSMGDERSLNLQLHELLTYLNQQGIVTILVLSPQGMLGPMKAPVDLTYLADTVLALRFFEADGAVHKAISVLKKRTGRHEATIRKLSIASSGIVVSAPLTEFRGVLTGVPVMAETVGRRKKRRPPKNARRR